MKNYNNSYERRIMNNRLKRTRQLRRRICVALISAVLIIAFSLGFLTIKANAQGNDNEFTYKYYKSITVGASDTLSGYALEYAKEGRTESYINEVMRINQLETDDITAGMNLILPYYSNEFVQK